MRRCATKRRTSRYSLCRFQFRDKAPATPKLNVIAVDELPSVFECGVVIRGIEPMREQKMTVKALNVVGPESHPIAARRNASESA